MKKQKEKNSFHPIISWYQILRMVSICHESHMESNIFISQMATPRIGWFETISHWHLRWKQRMKCERAKNEKQISTKWTCNFQIAYTNQAFHVYDDCVLLYCTPCVCCISRLEWSQIKVIAIKTIECLLCVKYADRLHTPLQRQHSTKCT